MGVYLSSRRVSCSNSLARSLARSSPCHEAHYPPSLSQHTSIKSKLQTDSLSKSERAFTGIVDCARKTWRTQGLKGFTNGLAPTLIRSPFGESFSTLFSP